MLDAENEEVVCLELREKFLKFVLPSIASMWAFSLYTMVDGVFVARGVGETAMAAVNLSAPFTSLVFMVGILLATGTSTIISIALGRGELEEFCLLDSDCQAMMKGAFERMGLTARGYDRILRVARTIADLDGSRDIQIPHLAEARQYRAVGWMAK